MTLRLPSGEVHIWSVPLDATPAVFEGLYATLADDERARSDRLRFERDRRRAIVARGVLRDLLARHLGTQPGRLNFVRNAFGKPGLSPEFGGRLRFNLSHSEDLALIALAADA